MQSVGSRNVKTVKGKEYLYYVVFEDGKKREIYCGPVSNPKSSRKAIELEIAQLREKRSEITEKIRKLEHKLEP